MFNKKKNALLELFEDNEINQKIEEELKNMTIKEKIIAFFKSFKYQSYQYQIVWTVRILCWILICIIILIGIVIRIKNKY